ncbi:MAG: response regulator [Bacteroidota bacterium]
MEIGQTSIFYIDDQRSALRLMQEYLSDVGIDVQVFTTMDEANRAIALSDTPEVVVLIDLKLSTSSGIDTIRQAAELWPHLPIIAVTGELHFEQRWREFLHAGADSWLSKEGLTGSIVRERVASVLGRRWMRPGGAHA